ncbi:MAG: hypothetical protein RLZZ58_319 [Pseudomonadota bacterium]
MLKDRLGDVACTITETKWIEPGHVLTLRGAGNPRLARAALAECGLPIDVVIRPAATPPTQLMVSDMDSTMITVECIDELADYAGIKEQVAAITERAMLGELDFEAALRARVALLAGLDEGVIAECLATRVRPMAGARTLVATLKKRGVRTILVSGGFHHFADPVAKMIGFDSVVANTLEIRGGTLTGRLAGGVVDAAVKAHTLTDSCAAMDVAPSAALALGDGANDVPMLKAAGLGIAFHAKPAAAKAADAHIAHGDLTAVLHALGIPRAEWVVKD